MFFGAGNEKRSGPLARIWLAATVEKKISKSTLLSTSIIDAVNAIVTAEAMPMQLRMSGQLLLGVARVYQRKVKYLMDDCSDTLAKVRSAFRYGGQKSAQADVDMPLDQQQAGKSAITRAADEGNDFDFNNVQNMDFDEWLEREQQLQAEAAGTKTGNVAKDSDITLRENNWDYLDANYGPDVGLDSQQFDGEPYQLDLDLGFDNAEPAIDSTPSGRKRKRASSPRDEGDRSVELGRDAVNSSARKSARLSSVDLGLDGMDVDADPTSEPDRNNMLDIEMEPEHSLRGRSSSLAMGDNLDFGGPPLDLDFGFDAPLDGNFDLDGLAPNGQSTPRATPPITNGHIDPHEEAAETAETTPSKPKQKRKKVKKPDAPIVDNAIEIVSPSKRKATGGLSETSLITRSGPEGYAERLAQGLISPPKYLPATRYGMALLNIQKDPVKHFVRREVLGKNGTQYMDYSPLGLAPELAELFYVPVKRTRQEKDADRAAETADRRKRARSHEEEGDDRDVELGRRSSRARQSSLGLDQGLDNFEAGALDFGNHDMGADDFRFPLESDDIQAQSVRESSVVSNRSNRSATSRRSSNRNAYLDDEVPLRGEGPLTVFDDLRFGASQAQSQATTPSKGRKTVEEEDEGETQATNKTASSTWSKSTVTAISVLSEQFNAVTVSDEPVTVSFKKTSEGASKRAAAAFFFELLVLGSRDCVEMKQESAFGNIDILAKAKFQEMADDAVPSKSTAGTPAKLVSSVIF